MDKHIQCCNRKRKKVSIKKTLRSSSFYIIVVFGLRNKTKQTRNLQIRPFFFFVLVFAFESYNFILFLIAEKKLLQKSMPLPSGEPVYENRKIDSYWRIHL